MVCVYSLPPRFRAPSSGARHRGTTTSTAPPRRAAPQCFAGCTPIQSAAELTGSWTPGFSIRAPAWLSTRQSQSAWVCVCLPIRQCRDGGGRGSGTGGHGDWIVERFYFILFPPSFSQGREKAKARKRESEKARKRKTRKKKSTATRLSQVSTVKWPTSTSHGGSLFTHAPQHHRHHHHAPSVTAVVFGVDEKVKKVKRKSLRPFKASRTNPTGIQREILPGFIYRWCCPFPSPGLLCLKSHHSAFAAAASAAAAPNYAETPHCPATLRTRLPKTPHCPATHSLPPQPPPPPSQPPPPPPSPPPLPLLQYRHCHHHHDTLATPALARVLDIPSQPNPFVCHPLARPNDDLLRLGLHRCPAPDCSSSSCFKTQVLPSIPKGRTETPPEEGRKAKKGKIAREQAVHLLFHRSWSQSIRRSCESS